MATPKLERLLLVIALLIQQATAFSTTIANPTTKPQTSPDSNEKQCDVGIVGSGPAGLVLAHALMDRGYSVHILERRSTFRPVGAALFMHPFALNSLKSISPRVEENLREACTPIRSISMSSIVDDDFGFGTDRLDEAPDVFGSPFVAVRFWDMLQALRKGLPDDIFRFGVRPETTVIYGYVSYDLFFILNSDSFSSIQIRNCHPITSRR